MGYGNYELPDGRKAGYGVTATCDAEGCENEINRGLGYLCGHDPDGHRDPDEAGCGKYFCHEQNCPGHKCPAPECGKYDTTEQLWCVLRTGHEGNHWNRDDDTYFDDTHREVQP